MASRGIYGMVYTVCSTVLNIVLWPLVVHSTTTWELSEAITVTSRIGLGSRYVTSRRWFLLQSKEVRGAYLQVMQIFN